jgi:hypothetical protein
MSNRMKTTFVCLVVVASAVGILFWGLYSVERSRSQKLSLDVSEAKQATVRRERELEQRNLATQMLQDKVEQLTAVLTNSTAQFRATSARLEDAERALAAIEAEQRQKEDARQKLAVVPAPGVTVALAAGGKESRTFVFPSVLDRNGLVLGTNMTFIQRYSRKLVFRPIEGTGSIAVDVDMIHPAILSYLNVDVETAKAEQLRTDAAWRAQQAADYQKFLDRQKLQQERQEVEERTRIERDKANAEIAKLSAEETAKREYADNERMKAYAAARMADAAMSGALAPVNNIINQNLNQNLIQNPHRRW